MGDLGLLWITCSVVAIVAGVILGRIENFRLTVAAVVAVVAVGIVYFVKSTERHGDGFGSIGQFIFGVLAIWVAVILLFTSAAVQMQRENARKEKQEGDNGNDHRP